jgi:branched-subunit amino acid aminotransferase/4-amino-4-deoxychorismate lyase
MRVIIDGVEVSEAEAAVSVFDWAVQRGFGVFEVIRSYDGATFRLDAHLERLQRSAGALHIEHPPTTDIADWARTAASAGGDCLVRVMVTGGSRDALVDTPPRTVVLWEPVPDVPERLRLLPVTAPWHQGGDTRGFPGVKWLSYAPNMASMDMARRAGFDDAVLVSSDGEVLEGPTYTVAWVSDGRVETPSLELGILASITREVLLECAARLGIPVKQGHFPLARMIESDEAIGLSTVKQVTPVSRIGENDIPDGPIAGKLAGAFAEIVAEEAVSG